MTLPIGAKHGETEDDFDHNQTTTIATFGSEPEAEPVEDDETESEDPEDDGS
jgi:hypothetical protein